MKQALCSELAEKETSQLEFLGTLKVDEKTSREWLIDAIWYFRSSDEKTEAILLALESEWNKSKDEVINDFCKLLTVKAPIKIMLFEGRGDPEEYVEALSDLGGRWLQHTQGDLIYVINFKDGKHKTWFCEVKGAGLIKEFKFQAIDELTGHDQQE